MEGGEVSIPATVAMTLFYSRNGSNDALILLLIEADAPVCWLL